MYHIFIHSSVDGHLGLVHILAVVNGAAVNIGMSTSAQINIFIFFGYMPKCGIVRSHGNSICSFLRNLHTVFHSDHTSLHSHQPPTV